MRLGERVIVAGDFNAKHMYWNCLTNNLKGKSLKSYIDSQNGRVTLNVSECPTYYPFDHCRSPSFLDLCLTKNINVVGKPASIVATDSDHNLVLIKMKMNQKCQQKIRLDYRRANWDLFGLHLDREMTSIGDDLIDRSVDYCLERFTKNKNS